MADNKIEIWVFADWLGMTDPKCIGMLSMQYGRGKQAFSFKYDSYWLSSNEQLLLDRVCSLKCVTIFKVCSFFVEI